MRFLRPAAGAGLALLLSATSALAADAYGPFVNYCAATHGDRAKALALADAAGWTTVNPAQVPIPAQPTFKLDQYAVRLKAEGQSFQVLVVGTGTATSVGKSYPADVCMAIAKPTDPGALAQVKAWAGAEPMMSVAASHMDIYGFEDTAGGGRKPIVAGSQEGRAALAAGRITMVLAATPPGDVALLAYVKLKP